jgi:hypothetical protein
MIAVEENVQSLPPPPSAAKAAATLAFEADENLARSESSVIVTAESEQGDFWVGPNPSQGTP